MPWATIVASTPISRRKGEARNQLAVARLVASAALERRESRGGHFRTDFPEPRPDFARRIAVSSRPAEIGIAMELHAATEQSRLAAAWARETAAPLDQEREIDR